MSRISSSVGLITGIPIEETVKKLIEVAARPRDLLQSRTTDLQKQQGALDTIGSRLLAFSFSLNKLKTSTVFQARTVDSSKKDAVQATASATTVATPGSYLVRPVRAATAHQVLSQAVADASADLGEGELSFRFGGFLDQGVSLAALNGGAGVPRGKIKITDRAGDSTTLDLTYARTVDDVLAAFNDQTDVAVTATTNGDSFVLADSSGGTGSLRVQEVGGGATAAGLGLAGINVAADSATGADVYRLANATKLSEFNGGNGVALNKQGVKDLEITLRTGEQLSVDLSGAETVGDVLAKLNAAGGGKLTASIAADGNRLQLTDATDGLGQFVVESGAVGAVAEELGLAGRSGTATIAGNRVLAGLRDTLLSTLNGGAGVGQLGSIAIFDRSGASAAVDLSTTETVGQVISAINAAGLDVTASLDAARGGVRIVDTSGGTGNLKIANADARQTVQALGIGVDAAVDSVKSGALNRQTFSRATLLSSLNGGDGVRLGDVEITNTDGKKTAIDLNSVGAEATTVGDVLDAINASSAEVTAEINATGDGILLVDRAGGEGRLSVRDKSAAGDVAASLKLTRTAVAKSIDGQNRETIDGTTSYSVDLSDLEISKDAIPLSSLNGGKGVALNDVRIVDSAGKEFALDLNGEDAVSTVGELIDVFNDKAAQFGSGVRARIDDSGTGILLLDGSHGAGKLKVTDVNGSAAKDLKIAGEGLKSGLDQVIDGIGLFSSSTRAKTGLNALAAKINSLDAGVEAAAVFDGAGYRLSITSKSTGAENQILVDAGETSFEFEQTSLGQDALLLYGSGAGAGGGVLLSSSDGNFSDAIVGVDLAVKDSSPSPVTVTVASSDDELVKAFQDIVSSYNAVRTDLDKLTAFDGETFTTGLLFGTSEAIQIDQRLSRAVTDRYFGVGRLQSLAEIGLSVNDDGTLALDKAKLAEAFAEDPASVRTFLTDESKGVIKKLGAVIDGLAGDDASLLTRRSDALKDTIEANNKRIEVYTATLDRQQERLTLQFYQLEQVISKLQQSQSALANLQALSPLTSSSKSQ
jgi:flagellar hook-associated protein 2